MQSLPYSIVTAYYNSVNRLDLWTTAGKVGILLGKQADIQQLEALIAMCVLGGRPAGDIPPRQATHTARYPELPCGRASISGGVGHVH